MITFTTKNFDALSNKELYKLLQLRAEVFVVEQTCPYLDMDDKDEHALHVLGYEGDRLVACSRLLPAGIGYKEPSIGRVVTHGSVRQKGYGKLLMQYSIEDIKKKYTTSVIVISAQQYLQKFYTELGFKTEGEGYLEDDIPHVKMRYTGGI